MDDDGDDSEAEWNNRFNDICQRTFKLDRKAFNKMKSICQNTKIKHVVDEK